MTKDSAHAITATKQASRIHARPTHGVAVPDMQADGAQKPASGRRRRGAASHSDVGQGRPVRRPRHCAEAYLGQCRASGEPSDAGGPSLQKVPQHLTVGWGRSPRPKLRAGIVVEAEHSPDRRRSRSRGRVQRHWSSTMPARSVGRLLLRHDRRPAERMPGKTSSFDKRVWWLAAIAATPPVFVLRRMGGRTRVCIIFRAIRNIDTLFGDTS